MAERLLERRIDQADAAPARSHDLGRGRVLGRFGRERAQCRRRASISARR